MIFSNSRYKDTQCIYDRNDTVVIDSRIKKTFDQSRCTLYLMKQGDTLDNISYKYYGKSCYYWAILDNNPQYLSELEIKIGDYILLPSYSEVVNGR